MLTPTTTAARPMGTGIFRQRLGLTSAVALAYTLGLTFTVLGLAGCGSSQSGAFAWVHPQPPPSEWNVAKIPGGAELAYPRSWQLQHGDPGTATAALIAADGRFVGYLNLTPRQGAETLANWTSFRIAHNVDEGDRSVRRLATATRLHFRTGHGSCVKDSYSTKVGARFIEIACIVAGPRGESVVVGATPPDRWSQSSTVIERAIESVTT